jgi:outer membrane lipoprotein-sorting protein
MWVVNNHNCACPGTVSKVRVSDKTTLGTYPVGDGPIFALFDGSNVWISNRDSHNVTKLQASDGALLGTFPTGGLSPHWMTFDGSNIWISNSGSNTLAKLRPSDGAVLNTFTTGGSNPSGNAFDGQNIWEVNQASNTVSKIRASDGVTLATIPTGVQPVGVAFDGTNIWVGNHGSDTVTKIRASDNAVLGTFPAGDGPYLLTSVGESIWVTNFNSNSVTKLRASDGASLSVTGVGANPSGVAFDGSHVWVSNHGTNTVTIVEAVTALQLPGLISHWRGEGNALDSVGPNHGTLQGNVTYTAGKVGQGFRFQDYGSEKVYIDSQVYEMTGGTTSLWFNWDGNQSVASANVMIGSSLGGVRRSPLFDVDTGFLLWEFGSLTRMGTNTQVVPGRWYHAVLTYDSNYNVKVYVNGVLVSGGTSVNPEEFRDNMAFGNWNDVGTTAGFGGIVDEVQIYNRPLTDCEVQNLYNAANGGACQICDNVAPSTNAANTSNANGAGWNKTNVSVLLSSSDNAGGTGVSQITFSATGAQTIAPTTVNGTSVNLSITAEGETTITFFARDGAGNTETAQSLIIKIDKSTPSVSCDAADGIWHANDVSIPCSANDSVSGLGNAADSNFNLTTNVPANTETANALTDSRTVCDVADNCSTAGAVSGNKVDKKAPTVAIATPSAGAVYLLNQSIASSYTCSDGGSGVASCAGPVASGSNIDTASVGGKDFAVNASDAVGNTSAAANTYIVRLPELTAFGPAQIWVGLKNSDDVGTKFDLLAEVFRNGDLIGSGQLNDVPGGSSGFNNASLRVINLALPQATGVGPGDTLSLRLSVRIAASSGHVSGTARLWFNDSAANSRFAGTIESITNNYFLQNSFILGSSAGPGPRKTVDVLVNRNQGGNPFKTFGTWSMTF